MSAAPTSPIDTVKEKVNGILAKYPAIDKPLTEAADKLKVDKAFLLLGAVAALPIIIFSFLSGGTLIIDMIGFVFPMYASIKAIESPAPDDDTVWLTYWLIFALFKIIEGSADFLLQYIPFYLLIKATFLVWCYYPKTQGAKLIYTAAIKPYVVPALGLEGAAAKKED